jgi:hypothetical protein
MQTSLKEQQHRSPNGILKYTSTDDSSASSATAETTASFPKSVAFHEVQIREFPTIMGE